MTCVQYREEGGVVSTVEECHDKRKGISSDHQYHGDVKYPTIFKLSMEEWSDL